MHGAHAERTCRFEEAAMHILVVNIRVKPEAAEEFRRLTLENARHSIHEPGVARFDVLQQQDDPTRFTLIEVYRTPDDPGRHKETAHYQAWAEAAGPLMAEPRTRAFFTNLFPGDERWG